MIANSECSQSYLTLVFSKSTAHKRAAIPNRWLLHSRDRGDFKVLVSHVGMSSPRVITRKQRRPDHREFDSHRKDTSYERNRDHSTQHGVTRIPRTKAARPRTDPLRSPMRELQAVLRSRADSLPDLQLRRSHFHDDWPRSSRGNAVERPYNQRSPGELIGRSKPYQRTCAQTDDSVSEHHGIPLGWSANRNLARNALLGTSAGDRFPSRSCKEADYPHTCAAHKAGIYRCVGQGRIIGRSHCVARS
jgi:hypothetical protein